MRCPRCGHLDDKVVDSRQAKDGESIRRRRECLECSHRYTTYEQVEFQLPLVVKRDDRREPFDRRKILAGLRVACQKRPISAEALEGLVTEVERKISDLAVPEIPAAKVGELVVAELRDLDQIAYLRFASVYHSYQSIQELLAEAHRLPETPRE